MKPDEKISITEPISGEGNHHYFRYHLPYKHLASIFGDDWFALKAEAFARFFGTPVFLVAQTIIVAIWICVNALGFTKFDVYPFILLNLAFSLQAAYAAPLILLAQTRQADTYDVPHIRFAGLDDDARYLVSLLPPWCKKAQAQLAQARHWADGIVLSGQALRVAGMSLPLQYPETAWLVSLARCEPKPAR